MKIIVYIIFAAILVGIVYVFSLFQELSYFALSKDYVEIGTLVQQPLGYRNGRVCVAGKYISGEGLSEIVDAEKPSAAIWVEAPVERSIFSTVWSQYISQDVYKTSVARVCGTFAMVEDGERGFGPNHQYRYKISK